MEGKINKNTKVNIIELGNLRIVSETESLTRVSEIFAKLVEQNKKMISPEKHVDIPTNMFG